MSQSTKPTSDNEKTSPTEQPLPDVELEKVSGGTDKGKVTLSPIVITKHVDKSSPILF
ncbi:MAG TPA: type VI secretion system tube protein Hcp [Dongiaceae bacterium]